MPACALFIHARLPARTHDLRQSCGKCSGAVVTQPTVNTEPPIAVLPAPALPTTVRACASWRGVLCCRLGRVRFIGGFGFVPSTSVVPVPAMVAAAVLGVILVRITCKLRQHIRYDNILVIMTYQC